MNEKKFIFKIKIFPTYKNVRTCTYWNNDLNSEFRIYADVSKYASELVFPCSWESRNPNIIDLEIDRTWAFSGRMPWKRQDKEMKRLAGRKSGTIPRERYFMTAVEQQAICWKFTLEIRCVSEKGTNRSKGNEELLKRRLVLVMTFLPNYRVYRVVCFRMIKKESGESLRVVKWAAKFIHRI